MPTQTIRFVVTGANPSTQSFPVSVGTNGAGTASFTLKGVNPGVDTIQAFLDAMSLSSNQSEVGWQTTNGLIAVTKVTGSFWETSGNGIFPPGSLGAPSFTQEFNSLMFNTHPHNIFPGDPHESGDQAVPVVNNSITAAGQYSGDVIVQGNGIQAGVGAMEYFQSVLTGELVVSQECTIAFDAYVDSSYVLGIKGASYVSGPQVFGGMTETPLNSYPLLAGQNNNLHAWQSTSANPQSIHFPAAGVYPFEFCWATVNHLDKQFCLLANGLPIVPVSALTMPPSPVPGSGKLALSPALVGPNVIGSSQVLNLVISGLVFKTSPYLPLFEGFAGSILISNDAGDNNLTLPQLPGGGTYNDTSAAASIFSLAGDNGSWQGKLSVGYSGPGFQLLYNGSAVDANIASTQLTVSAEDIAWYSPGKNTFDLYTSSAQGGGSSTEIEIEWLVQPKVASTIPATIPGDGGTYTITVNLTKPLPPVQNNIAATFTGTGGITVKSVANNTNSAGFVTGFTVTVSTAVVGSNTNTSLTMNATGMLNYLSGTSFVNQTQHYITNLSLPISLLHTTNGANLDLYTSSVSLSGTDSYRTSAYMTLATTTPGS